MKANIKPLLVSSLERSVQVEGSYFVEAPISVPNRQVDMKHRKVSSEKIKVDSNPFLDQQPTTGCHTWVIAFHLLAT